MIDFSPLEREFRRILNSHQSMVHRKIMADQLFQKINAMHAGLADDQARSQFRNAYREFAERSFPLPRSFQPTNQTRLKELFLDHARNLKEVEATQEKLNRELGDF
jgi:hypothetical protein